MKKLLCLSALIVYIFACCPSSTTPPTPVAEPPTQPPAVPSEPTDTPQPPPPPTEAPMATTAPTDTPAQPPPTPTPSQPSIEILSSTSYADDIGYFHVVGEVRNNGDQPMAFVKVVATLYDDADQVTGTDFTYTELDVIPPGGKSPFETGTDQWQGTTKYKLQVEGSPGPAPRQDVVILSHSSYVDDIGYFHVKGEVQNNGSDPATFVKIVVTLYDAGGNVMGTDFTYTELDTVLPGSTSPFETGTDHWEGFDHYEIQVQAQ